MPNAPRNTGLQVIHYAAARITAQTPFIMTGALLGELPLGAMITDADLAVTGAFGGGAMLQFHRSPGGPVVAAVPISAPGRFNLSNATNPLQPSEAVVGGPLYVSVNNPPAPGAALVVVVSFAPALG